MNIPADSSVAATCFYEDLAHNHCGSPDSHVTLASYKIMTQSHTHTVSHTVTHTHRVTHTHTESHTHTHTHTYTHTHTHTPDTSSQLHEKAFQEHRTTTKRHILHPHTHTHTPTPSYLVSVAAPSMHEGPPFSSLDHTEEALPQTP